MAPLTYLHWAQYYFVLIFLLLSYSPFYSSPLKGGKWGQEDQGKKRRRNNQLSSETWIGELGLKLKLLYFCGSQTKKLVRISTWLALWLFVWTFLHGKYYLKLCNLQQQLVKWRVLKLRRPSRIVLHMVSSILRLHLLLFFLFVQFLKLHLFTFLCCLRIFSLLSIFWKGPVCSNIRVVGKSNRLSCYPSGSVLNIIVL